MAIIAILIVSLVISVVLNLTVIELWYSVSPAAATIFSLGAIIIFIILLTWALQSPVDD